MCQIKRCLFDHSLSFSILQAVQIYLCIIFHGHRHHAHRFLDCFLYVLRHP